MSKQQRFQTKQKWIPKNKYNDNQKYDDDTVEEYKYNDYKYKQSNRNHGYYHNKTQNRNYQKNYYQNGKKGSFVDNKKINMNPKLYTNYNVICKDDDINTIRVLSWNLNIDHHSKYASNEWILNNDKWQLIYSQIIKQKPDIIALQELPKDPKRSEFLQYFVNTKQWCLTREFETKHIINDSDGSIILINNKLLKYYKVQYNGNNNNIDSLHKWPGVILYDKIKNECKLLLYSIHFFPSKQYFKQRRDEFDELYHESIKNKMNDIFVCIGDTNMRENEEESIKKDYNLQSCWDIIPKKLKQNDYFTWHWNYFKPGNYYSLRYDRMFMSQNIKCKNIHIFDEPVSKNNNHFLSDHRGIIVTIKI